MSRSLTKVIGKSDTGCLRQFEQASIFTKMSAAEMEIVGDMISPTSVKEENRYIVRRRPGVVYICAITSRSPNR